MAVKLLGTVQLRRIAEAITGRDFSGAFNEDVIRAAPEVMLLSLDDLNKAFGTEYEACEVRAWGGVPVRWTEEAVLVPGNGLPSWEDQMEDARRLRESAERQEEAHPEQESVDEEQA